MRTTVYRSKWQRTPWRRSRRRSAVAGLNPPPAAPTGLTAVPTPTAVILDWNDNAEADFDHYRVYTSPVGMGDWSVAANVYVSTWTTEDMVAGDESDFRVTAVDAAGHESDPSATVVMRAGPPEAPDLYDVETAGAGTSPQWTDSPYATSYRLERSPDGSTWTALVTQSGTSYVDTGTYAGDAYYYRVRASNAGGNSDWTQAGPYTAQGPLTHPVDTTPPVLSSPTATVTGATTATLGVTTGEGDGTLYVVVTTSGTAPTAARVIAGQDAAGNAAAFADSTGLSTAGAKSFSATGLTDATAYYAHFVQQDSAGNQSEVVTSGVFTTAASPTTYGTRAGIEGIYGATDVSAYADVNDNQDADDIAAQIDRARRAMYNRINLALAKAGLTAPATSDNFSQFDILADVENELAGVWLYFKRGKNDNDPNGPAQMQWHWDNAMSVLDQAIGVDVGDDPDIVGAGEFQFVPIRRTTPTDENSE